MYIPSLIFVSFEIEIEDALQISSALFSERQEICESGEESQSDGSTQSKLLTPKEVMVLPLFKRPLFPGIVAPIVVPNEPFTATLQAIRDKMPVNVGVFLAKKTLGKSQFNKLEHIHPVGLLAQVMRVFPHKQVRYTPFSCGVHHYSRELNGIRSGNVPGRVGRTPQNQSDKYCTTQKR